MLISMVHPAVEWNGLGFQLTCACIWQCKYGVSMDDETNNTTGRRFHNISFDRAFRMQEAYQQRQSFQYGRIAAFSQAVSTKAGAASKIKPRKLAGGMSSRMPGPGGKWNTSGLSTWSCRLAGQWAWRSRSGSNTPTSEFCFQRGGPIALAAGVRLRLSIPNRRSANWAQVRLPNHQVRDVGKFQYLNLVQREGPGHSKSPHFE
ncbi:hypothetical protein HOY82DRAFT_110766 [Tuber indicum]|nr:hypothetical protein HOY82DRAFT_110766 [Tuber indicum]